MLCWREAKKVDLEVNKENTKYLLVTIRAGVRPRRIILGEDGDILKDSRILSTWKYLSQTITKGIAKAML